MRESVKSLLKDKNYESYFWATAFSMGASNILQFTLALYILEKTGSPLIYASILSVIVVPRILLTPIGGVIGDRFKRVNIMKMLNAFQLMIMAVYAIYARICGDISIISVYLLVILLEMIEVFYNAAESAVLSEIVAKDFLEEAVTLSRVDDGIVFVTTPIAAAFIYNQFGISATFMCITVLILLCLFLTFCIETKYASARRPERSEGIKTYGKEFQEGLKELKKDKFAVVFVIVAPLVNFSFSAVFSVIISYVFLDIFQLSDYAYGIYRTATAGVSIVLPFFLLPIIKKFQAKTLLKYAVLSISVILFLIGASMYFGMSGGQDRIFLATCLITLLDCLIITSVMPLNIATRVFFQKNIKDEYRSRIMSVFSMLTLSSVPLGNMFYGFLANWLPAYLCAFIASFAVFLSYPLILYLTKER